MTWENGPGGTRTHDQRIKSPNLRDGMAHHALQNAGESCGLRIAPAVTVTRSAAQSVPGNLYQATDTVSAPVTRLRKLRFYARRNAESTDGRTAFYVGLRVGYYPCLDAPFVQLALAYWRFEFWYGLPSYKHARGERP